MNDYLKNLQPVHAAHYDAALPSNFTKRVMCTNGTRVELLENIRVWTRDVDGAKIYWVNGMAGTGKTTIAYTICAILQKDRQLGASFFCSRNSPDCRDVMKIVPTIAYQLGRYSNPFRQALCEQLDDDPDFAMRSINTQFEHLIAKPLAKVAGAMPKDVVVVIDALDECTDVSGTRGVLNLLLQYADSLPIKFFVSSRPEPAISDRMTASSGALRSILWLHDIEKSLVQADIKTYLTEALASIQITSSELDQLAAQAGSLFIFAATAVRYIIPDDVVDHQERLQTILDIHPEHVSKRYQELDVLYQTILSKALGGSNLENKEVERRRCVLWTVVCAREPMSPATLSELMDLGTERQLWLAIQPLQSVLHMSASTDTVSTLHASFPDFLLSPERSGVFHCNPEDHNSYLAARCFTRMEQSLRFNMCNLENSYMLDRDVPDLDDRVAKAVSSGLFYACRYWSSHLTSANPSTELALLLDGFLKHRLLFWMEALNLKTWIHSGEAVLSKAVDWLSTNNNCTGLRDFAHDARNFVTTFAANPCSLSTPHIYISMLPLALRQSHVWKNYWPQTQGLMRIEGPAIDQRAMSALVTWDAGCPVTCITKSNDGRCIVFGSSDSLRSTGTLSIWDVSSGGGVLGPMEAHRKEVTSVAFSPDDAYVASSSLDNTICIWDANQGNLITGPLRRHSMPVRCIVFSPDGSRLASGSDDCNIRMWDAHTGTPKGIMLGHRGAVLTLAVSPDGKHLASGSSDRMIRVWDWRTSAMAQSPIEGHKAAVRSIAYSRDGLQLASGSDDCTVRVRDVSNGMLLVALFEGHASAVNSISFSPDGTQVVSGSDDETVRVWDAVSGRSLAGPFEGHTKSINSVLFTADGTRVLSGSRDQTIRVWDARHQTAGTIHPLGHAEQINSISLSPDSTRVASGSWDKTICIWDTHNGALIAGPFGGHADSVLSVAYSPDGSRIVSGSRDQTLRVWNASTGALLAGPIKGHTGSVLSVAFSPDGSQIASGSWDQSIRLWDSRTGKSVAKLFKSHIRGVTSVAFSPDGSRIVSGSYSSRFPFASLTDNLNNPFNEPKIRMWLASDGAAPLWTSYVHTGDVNCVVFSPDGRRVVSGSSDQTILVLDAGDGAVLHGPFTGHTHWVFSVAFSPDGTRVVSGSWDKTVRMWEVESGVMAAGPLRGHTDKVESVAFSPDGARIISSSADGTIRIWDVAAIAHASATSSDDWFIDHEGWLIDSRSQYLLWVPPDLRRRFGFLTPSNPIVSNAGCRTRIDGSTLLGDRWSECYVGGPG